MSKFDSDLLGRIMDDIHVKHHKFERTSFKHITVNKDRDKIKRDTICKNSKRLPMKIHTKSDFSVH